MSTLVDAAYRRARARIAESHRIGLRVFDAKGTVITQLSGGQSAWDSLWESPQYRGALTQFITELKATRLKGEEVCVMHDPIAHMAFMGVSIDYEFEKMGTIILGPFHVRNDRAHLKATLDVSTLTL